MPSPPPPAHSLSLLAAPGRRRRARERGELGALPRGVRRVRVRKQPRCAALQAEHAQQDGEALPRQSGERLVKLRGAGGGARNTAGIAAGMPSSDLMNSGPSRHLSSSRPTPRPRVHAAPRAFAATSVAAPTTVRRSCSIAAWRLARSSAAALSRAWCSLYSRSCSSVKSCGRRVRGVHVGRAVHTHTHVQG